MFWDLRVTRMVRFRLKSILVEIWFHFDPELERGGGISVSNELPDFTHQPALIMR